MSAGTILSSLFALAAILGGFSLAFRQRHVRALWAWLFPTRPGDPPLNVWPEGGDPVRYAPTIFGIILMAFGLLIFAFTTSYAVLTAPS